MMALNPVEIEVGSTHHAVVVENLLMFPLLLRDRSDACAPDYLRRRARWGSFA